MDPGSQHLTDPEPEHWKIPSHATVFVTLFLLMLRLFLLCLFLIECISLPRIGLKRHACITADRPDGAGIESMQNKAIPLPLAGASENGSLLKIKKRPSTTMPDGSPIPPCHLCHKHCPHLRGLKEHYIKIHYRSEFREKYTGGKPISHTVEGNCQLCPYIGKTKELVLHVGIAHGKLKEFLPDEVWDKLFGHQVRKFKTPL
jgi:hypothetical protein